jgi:Prion-inhibition and propagation
MDPISFSLAVAGIPALFKSGVDCFQYIRLGQNFGKDYGFCLAKIEAAELQFTRWAASMGLLDESFDVNALFNRGSWKEEDIKKARKWLGLINDAFEDARKTSEKYKLSFDDEDQPEVLGVPDPTTALDKAKPPVKRLVLSMREITKKRQRNVSVGSQIKWALYRKGDFESLIETVCRIIDNLVKLFPALEPRQKELANEEVKEVEKESIPELVKVLGQNDKLLNLAVTEEIKAKGHVFQDIVIDGKGLSRFGDTWEDGSMAKGSSGGMSFSRMHIGGSGSTYIGHYYGSGKGVDNERHN